MPSVPIYIRNEDYSKWLAIENKAQFIHNALNKGWAVKAAENLIERTPELKETETPIQVVKNLFPKAKELCEIHGTPLTLEGRCLQKGCKFA